MLLDMVTVQGAFLIVWEHLNPARTHEVEPTVMWRVSPMQETRIRGPCLVGDRGAQCLKAAPVGVLLLLVDGHPGRVSVVMTDIQHNTPLLS